MDINNPKDRKAYGTLCGIVGIILNVVLFFVKYFAGLLSGSVAIVADAFNNLSDAGSSFITLIGFIFAGKKPDIDHPYGHGRFEYISGFIVSLLIILMGWELLQSSGKKIFNPEEVDGKWYTIAILLLSIIIKLYMAYYNNSVGKKINSEAMKATATDSLSDCLSTVVVLISIIFMNITNINIDGYCGVLVAIFVTFAGFKAVKETMAPLLGQPPEPEFVQHVIDIVMKHEEVNGIHDLVVHDYGPGRRMISLHAEVDGNGNIFELHDMIDRIENELSDELFCDAVIHLDPIETDNVVVIETKIKVAEKLKEINEHITIHDFRMVTGPTHTNLIFDVVEPYEMKESEQQMRNLVTTKVKELDDNYEAVVHIDRSYIS